MRTKLVSVLVVLTLLFLVSDLLVLSGLEENTRNAYTSSTSSMLQYEWPQFMGNSSFTRFSAGPAPEAPDTLWKATVTGIQSYISAFNGKVYVCTKTKVYALDRENGTVLWSTTVPAPGPWPTVFKIDATHMVVGSSCLNPETGVILWTSGNFSASPEDLFASNVYSPEEKKFFVKQYSYVYAWDFSDPSHPPTLAWQTYVAGGGSEGSGVQYGDGKVFPGSSEPHQVALDAETGDVLWETETKASMIFSGAYSNGKFFRGGAHDNTFYAFNATNGETLWTYYPGTDDGYWCTGVSVAYDMVYELNKDGNLYALNVNTGKLIWKYKGPGLLMFPGNPTVADGKIYATTGQAATYGNVSSTSEFACLDAYTGQLIWKLPIEAFAPRESVAIAYGNLYIIPGEVTTAVDSISSDEYETLNQIWAFGTRDWPMWRHDPSHTGVGQSGPSNLTSRWNYTTNGAVISSPSVANGIAYFGSQDKNIYAVDARSGNFIWKYVTGNRIASSPAVANGKVYSGTDDGYVYCLDAYNGSRIWKTFTGGYIPADFSAAVKLRSSPTVVNGYVYVGALDNKTYCLNANNGVIAWTYPTQGYIVSSPAVVDNAVYITSQEPTTGVLYKLNANNGSLIWKKPLPYQPTFMGGTDMQASPTVANGMVFASSDTSAYYGINAATGETVWTFKDDSAQEFIVCSPVYNDGKLFIIDKFSIVCLGAQSGNIVWEAYIGDELYVSPSYADGRLYVVTDQRSIYILNATDGSRLGRLGTSSNSWSAPTIYEGRVYTGNNDWNVYCIANYAALSSNLTIALETQNALTGELVTGCGILLPKMVSTNVTVTLIKPNGAVTNIPISTSEQGDFTFTFTPDAPGNWTVTAQWLSDRSYYASTTSEPVYLSVEPAPTPTPTATPSSTPTPTPLPTASPTPTPPPIPFDQQMLWGIPIMYIYIAVIIALAAVIAVAAFVLRRRAK
jgi:outer membrane protein assembly factor BamB